jgi:hypothetical protein
MKLREAAQAALEALESLQHRGKRSKTIEDLRAALDADPSEEDDGCVHVPRCDSLPMWQAGRAAFLE